MASTCQVTLPWENAPHQLGEPLPPCPGLLSNDSEYEQLWMAQGWFPIRKTVLLKCIYFLKKLCRFPIFMKNLLGNIPSSLRCLLRTEKDRQGARSCSPCVSVSVWDAELTAVCTGITAVCRGNTHELLEALVNNCWALPNDQTFQTINFTLIILRKPACLTRKSSIIMKIRKPKCLMLQKFLRTL